MKIQELKPYQARLILYFIRGILFFVYSLCLFSLVIFFYGTFFLVSSPFMDFVYTNWVEKNNISKMSYVEVIERIKTPQEAKKYILGYLEYKDDISNWGQVDYWASFSRIHKNGSDDCEGGAFAAAALLQDNGYPPLMLAFGEFGKKSGHAVYIYKENGKWGTLGIDITDCHDAKYDTVDDIVRSYGGDYYNVYNLENTNVDWLNTDLNIKNRFYFVESGNFLYYSPNEKLYRNNFVKVLFWWLL